MASIGNSGGKKSLVLLKQGDREDPICPAEKGGAAGAITSNERRGSSLGQRKSVTILCFGDQKKKP